jgi:hypothetical protein
MKITFLAFTIPLFRAMAGGGLRPDHAGKPRGHYGAETMDNPRLRTLLADFHSDSYRFSFTANFNAQALL